MATSTPLKYPIYLSDEQREELELVCRNGHSPAKKIRRARVILLSDRNREGGRLTRTQIAELVNIHPNSVDDIRKQFVLEGPAPTINRKVRSSPPRPPIFDGAAEAQLIAICCSDPPAGHVHWTMELLAETLMERRIVTQVSSETVRRVLKKRTQALETAKLVRS